MNQDPTTGPPRVTAFLRTALAADYCLQIGGYRSFEPTPILSQNFVIFFITIGHNTRFSFWLLW